MCDRPRYSKLPNIASNKFCLSLNYAWYLTGLSLIVFSLVDTKAQFGTTIPVGCEATIIAPAADASTPVSTVFSIPLYNKAVFGGPVVSVDNSTAFSTSAAWSVNQFIAGPYLVHVTAGASVGRTFLITANTTSQLTVVNRGYDLTTTLAAGDTFEIIPANTLGSLFGTNNVPFQTGNSASQADNVLLWNGTNWDTYYHNGTSWRRSGSLQNLNATILYPEEGFYVTRRATAPLTLPFVGTIPSTTERTDLPGPGGTFIANRFPFAATLNGMGFQNMPGWQTGISASQADQVLLWNGTNWLVFYFNGSNWKRSGSLQKFDTQPIPFGSAMYISRQSSASGSESTLTQPLPYPLN